MDFGRIIIGLYLIVNTLTKFRKKQISLSRMSFSMVCGLCFLMQGITFSFEDQIEQHLTKEQMVYLDYFGQFLTACLLFLIGRFFWEIWRAKRAVA